MYMMYLIFISISLLFNVWFCNVEIATAIFAKVFEREGFTTPIFMV